MAALLRNKRLFEMPSLDNQDVWQITSGRYERFCIKGDAGPYPAIVFIHGGDWIGGDRTQMTKIIEEIASHGYVGMAIDYDLSPRGPFSSCSLRKQRGGSLASRTRSHIPR